MTASSGVSSGEAEESAEESLIVRFEGVHAEFAAARQAYRELDVHSELKIEELQERARVAEERARVAQTWYMLRGYWARPLWPCALWLWRLQQWWRTIGGQTPSWLALVAVAVGINAFAMIDGAPPLPYEARDRSVAPCDDIEVPGSC